MFTTSAFAGVETPVASLARTVSGDSGRLIGGSPVKTLRAQLNVTAVGGTTPTLDVVIQDTLDRGVTWNTIGTFTQKGGPAREVINIAGPMSRELRVAWTIGGTTPSFTFEVDWAVESQ